MNASSHHPKIKLSITPGEALFVAGTYVTGKLEMECRAEGERGLGIGVVMIELFAIQGELFCIPERTKPEPLHVVQNLPRGTTWQPTHFYILVDSFKDQDYLRLMPSSLIPFLLLMMSQSFHRITFLPVGDAVLSSFVSHFPERVPAQYPLLLARQR